MSIIWCEIEKQNVRVRVKGGLLFNVFEGYILENYPKFFVSFVRHLGFSVSHHLLLTLRNYHNFSVKFAGIVLIYTRYRRKINETQSCIMCFFGSMKEIWRDRENKNDQRMRQKSKWIGWVNTYTYRTSAKYWMEKHDFLGKLVCNAAREWSNILQS